MTLGIMLDLIPCVFVQSATHVCRASGNVTTVVAVFLCHSAVIASSIVPTVKTNKIAVSLHFILKSLCIVSSALLNVSTFLKLLNFVDICGAFKLVLAM